MDNLHEDDVPQITVETEVIKRSLSSKSNNENVKHVTEENSTPETITSLSTSSTLEKDQSVLPNDSDIKKLNQEFGIMENISLETSIQEKMSVVQSVDFENPASVSQQPPESSTNLSKYFNTESSNQEVKDPEGLSFFDALAENPSKSGVVEDICTDQNSTKTEKLIIPSGVENIGDKSSNISEVPTEVVNKEDVSAPILLKFFSEDKSGKDKDGKAFFDKIADDKIVSALEITEPILNVPAAEFLNLPVSSSEIEDAWIPSEKTRQILVSINTANSPFTPDKNDLTIPGIIIEEEMEDPVKALLVECNSIFAQKRKALTVNDVSEDEMGLKKLMLWYTRLALFIKLRKFSLAEVESVAFGTLDKPDLFYEFYPDIYKGKKGTMVPFALRLLLAELPQYQGNHQSALDNMYRLLSEIQKMINNVQNGYAEDGCMIELPDSRKKASLELLKKREKGILFSILNCVLGQKDYILAVSIAKHLIEKSGSDTAQLHSALGRIYLQLGDVHCAENCFKRASVIASKVSKDFRVEENINNALLAVACDDNEQAFTYFEQAYTIQPNAMLINNMAVCKLYTGQLKESLKLLEFAIKQSPSSCLHDGLLFNVCTLYELESSRCPQKKLALLELVSQYAGDAFNISCLKIQATKA